MHGIAAAAGIALVTGLAGIGGAAWAGFAATDYNGDSHQPRPLTDSEKSSFEKYVLRPLFRKLQKESGTSQGKAMMVALRKFWNALETGRVNVVAGSTFDASEGHVGRYVSNGCFRNCPFPKHGATVMRDGGNLGAGDRINVSSSGFSNIGLTAIRWQAAVLMAGYHLCVPSPDTETTEGQIQQAKNNVAALEFFQWGLLSATGELGERVDEDQLLLVERELAVAREMLQWHEAWGSKSLSVGKPSGNGSGLEARRNGENGAAQNGDIYFVEWMLDSFRYEGTPPWVGARTAPLDGSPGLWRHYDMGFEAPTAMTLGFDADSNFCVFIAGSDTSGTQGGLRMMKDTDEDFFAEPETLTTLAAPGAFRFPHSVVWANGNLFVLDLDLAVTQTARVHVLRDTDGDRVPDAAPELWADMSVCPWLFNCRSLNLQSAPTSPVAHVWVATHELNDPHRAWDTTMWLLEDQGAGQPPLYSEVPQYQRVWGMEPSPVHLPIDGDMSVRASGNWNSEIALYSLDDGTTYSRRLLGTASITSSSLETEVASSEALTSGQVLQFLDHTQETEGIPFPVVGADTLQAFSLSPASAYYQDLVTIRGRNFPADYPPSLYMDGRPVDVESYSDTMVAFRTPYFGEPGYSKGVWHPVEFQYGIFAGAFTYLGARPGVNVPPYAAAGPDRHVLQGTTVTLDATASFDEDGDPLTFFWFGPVTLDDPTAPRPTFVAPPTDSQLPLFLTLNVSDDHAHTEQAYQLVTVHAEYPAGDLDGDFELTPADAEMMIDALLGRIMLTSDEADRADANSDGVFDVGDLVTLLLGLAGA